jgi:hypothetical protein
LKYVSSILTTEAALVSKTAITPDLETSPEIGSAALRDEIQSFIDQCATRHKFNSRWDTALNVFGIALSIGIVVAGVFNQGAVSAILGGIVAGTVAAQRAFPFAQRTLFYRNLLGLGENLKTDATQGLISVKDAVALLKSLRLDFAQQLPRGTTFKPEPGDGRSQNKVSS